MTDYLTKRSMIIAVVLTAGIFVGSVGWYLQTSDADITNESRADIYNFVKENYVTKAQLEDIKDAIAAPHLEFNDISKNFTSIAKTLTNHNNQLLVLRTATQTLPPPTSSGTGDYDIKTINIQTFQVTTEFPQDMPVYITGIYDGGSNQIDYEVRKNGQFVKSGSAAITAGTFTFAYNVDGTAELGTYVVNVSIDNKKDTVTFQIE